MDNKINRMENGINETVRYCTKPIHPTVVAMDTHEPRPSNNANIGRYTVRYLLSSLYGLELRNKKQHRSWADQIYHVTVAMATTNEHIKKVSKNGYLLKIINTEDSKHPEIYEAHDKLLSYVQSQNIPVTRLLPTTDGRRVFTHKLVRDGTTDVEGQFLIQLFDFWPGLPLSEVDCWRDLLSEYGAMLGRLHTALQGYQDDRLDSHGGWNRLSETPDHRVEGALEGCFHDDQRATVHQIEALYVEKLTPVLHLLKKGVIHGDYRPENVIASRTGDVAGNTGNSGYGIAAIIDFNDSSTGHYVYDVGIAVGDVIKTCDDDDERLALASRILQGYLSEFSLSATELDTLQICACLRLLGHATSREDRDDVTQYVTRSWDALKLLLTVGNVGFKERCLRR